MLKKFSTKEVQIFFLLRYIYKQARFHPKDALERRAVWVIENDLLQGDRLGISYPIKNLKMLAEASKYY